MSIEGTAKQTEIEPYEEQEPFLWDSHRYYGFISGVGAGKTAVGVMRTALNANLWNPGSMGAIVAPSTRMIKNAIFPVMDDFGLREKWDFTGFQAEEPGFHTPEGGRIVILSADNERTVERLANLNLSFWWLDEAKETPKRARDVLRERLRVGNYRNGYITTTPKGYDHNYDFFVGNPKSDDALQEQSYGQAALYHGYDDRLCVVGVPSWANPHTPEDYHDEMRDLPEQIRLQQAEGQFVEIGAGVFTKDMLSFVEPDSISEDWPLNYVMGVDPAVTADAKAARDNDTDFWAACLLAVHRRTNQAWVLDIELERGMTLQEGVNWVKRIAKDLPSPHIFVESNQSQVWLRQALGDTGLTVSGVETSRNKEDKLVDLTVPLEQDTVKLLNRDVDKKLGYDPRFKELVDQMLAFPEGTHDDALDALYLAVSNANLSTGLILGSNPYGENDE